MPQFSIPMLDGTRTRLKELADKISPRQSASELLEGLILGITDEEATAAFSRGHSKRIEIKNAQKAIRKTARAAIASLSTEKLEELFGKKPTPSAD